MLLCISNNLRCLLMAMSAAAFMCGTFALGADERPVSANSVENSAKSKPQKAETPTMDRQSVGNRGRAATTPLEGSKTEVDQKRKELEELKDEATGKKVRRFHEVMEELLAEFGFDVKSGQLNGLKNVAIRKIEVSDTLPRSYESYTELLVAERIRENSQVRLVSCIPCKTRTSALIEGKLMITSPTTNIAQLNDASRQLGVDNFMDIVLIYHTTHMVLAMQIFDATSKEMVWARSYNSETVRSRYQRLAVDYSQVIKGRESDEYSPEFRKLIGIGAASVPNVSGQSVDKTFIDIQLRGTEKFNNRHDEFGLQLSTLISVNKIAKEYPTTGPSPTSTTATPTETQLTPFTFALGLYAIYAHNFMGEIESFDHLRQGFHVGPGVLMAPSYIATGARGGWDLYFGKKFVTSASLLYIMPSSVLVGGTSTSVSGGMGFDAVLSYNL